MNSISSNSGITQLANLTQALMGNTNALQTGLDLTALTTDNVNLTTQAANLTGTTAAVVSTDSDTTSTDTDNETSSTSSVKNAATDATNADDYESFTETFTADYIADLLGLDADSLTDSQTKDLQELLYNLNSANAEREANGEEAMTKDEVNAFLKDEINKANNDEQSSLGQTLNELGIEELSDDQFNNVTEALNKYNNGAEETTEDDATEATEDASSTDGTSGTGSTGGTSAAGGTSSASDATGSAEDELPEDLNELQQMKSTAEGELGELKNTVEDKKSAINDRKQEIMEEKLQGEQDEQTQGFKDDYEEAKTEYDEATKSKQTAQDDLTKAEQDSCANEQSLYANAQSRQQNSADLSSAQSELASLQPPASSDSDDESSQSAMAEYEAKKAELEAKITSLEQEKQQLETEYQSLEQEKQQINETKTQAQTDIETQTQAQEAAQTKMDEAMNKLTESNEELQKALEEDEELQNLEQELKDAEQAVADKEAEIEKIDQQISAVEAKDETVQDLREDEADAAFKDSLEEANYTGGEAAEAKYSEEIAQETYGKSYDELTDDEKNAIEMEIDGATTTEAMEWAQEQLKEDPNNEAAKNVLMSGQQNLAQQEKVGYAEVTTAIDKMPASVREGAAAAMEEAITKAESNGEDANTAAMNALSEYTSQQANNSELDLSDEDKAALQDLSGKSASYADAMDRTNAGYQMLVDENMVEAADRTKATDVTTALYSQVLSGANSQQIANMLAAMGDMVGMSEHNASDAAEINKITGESGINCSTTPWCAAYAMNMLNDYGILDTSSCSNVNYCPTINSWAKEQGLWENSAATGGDYTPNAGDAVLFDWEGDGGADHIGIVEKVENGVVYTIEGNSSDSVARRQYEIGSGNLLGYIDCSRQE